MDQDATWYGGIGLGPGDIVSDGDPAPSTVRGTVRLCGFRHISTSGLGVGASRASFIAVFGRLGDRYMSIVATRSPISATAELLLI